MDSLARRVLRRGLSTKVSLKKTSTRVTHIPPSPLLHGAYKSPGINVRKYLNALIQREKEEQIAS